MSLFKTEQNKKINFFHKKIDLNELLFIFIGGVLIIIIGVFVTLWFKNKVAEEEKNKYIDLTNVFVGAINPARIENLSFSSDDLENPDYLRVEEQLRKMQDGSRNSGIRWIYTMTIKNDEILFGPDSILENEYGDGAPGEVFEASPNTRNEILRVFNTGDTSFFGPDSDQWGTWITTTLPIRDFKTGQIVGLLAIDVDYNTYQNSIFRQQLLPMFSTLLFLALFISVSHYYFSNRRIIFKVKENEKRYHDLYELSVVNNKKIIEDRDKIKSISEEYQRINKLMVGRELEMIRLKKEISDLKNNSNNITSNTDVK